jgi:hypothetical protein
MSAVTDLQKRIEQAEESARQFFAKPLTAWDAAGAEHLERVEQLELAWKAAEVESNDTNAARGRAVAQLRRHGEKLLTVDLADVPEWAATAARLTAEIDAYSDRYRLQQPIVESAKQRYRTAAAENPAILVKASHVRNLLATIDDPDASMDEKKRAWKELDQIAEDERIKVIDFTPPEWRSQFTAEGIRIR